MKSTVTLATLFLMVSLLIACAPPSSPTSTLPTSTITPQRTILPPSQPATLPLHDAHLHYSRNSWDTYPVSTIQAILDRAGIQRALVSSTPNEGTLKLYETDPARYVPEFRPYRTEGDLSRWITNPETIAFIEQGLTRGVYRSIGEFHLNGDEAKTPVVQRVVEIAVERNLILHAHSDDAAIENLFAINPRARILWGHTGMSTPLPTIEKMLERHPNLWAELSYRYDVTQNGKLDPAWQALFLRFPDRFMYGTDTWIESRWEALPSLASTARGWLAELPQEVAAKIASRNFEAVFGN